MYRRRALEHTQRQLGALELFKSVRIEAQHVDQKPTDVPILIAVTEQNPWRWNLALGYAAGERLGLEARLRNMNFLGGARRVELGGSISKIEHLVEATFTQPQLVTPRLALSLLARDWSIDDPAFRAVSTGGQGAVTWMHTPQFSATFAYAASRERSRMPSGLDSLTGLQTGMLSAWSVDLDRRTPATASPAPSGLVLMLHLEQAGGWMPGTFNYYNTIGEVRDYYTTRNGRITLAARGRYGSISPMHQELDIPILKRFFLGGSGQMRGWSRFEVGPLSPSGEPIGGNSLLSATSEIRVRLRPKLRGALFVEAGNVWRSAWTAHLGDLRYDAGPGLRIETPFGLIRVDLGYQLNRIEGLRNDGQRERHRWRINIGVGEAF